MNKAESKKVMFRSIAGAFRWVIDFNCAVRTSDDLQELYDDFCSRRAPEYTDRSSMDLDYVGGMRACETHLDSGKKIILDVENLSYGWWRDLIIENERGLCCLVKAEEALKELEGSA
jgi:hypothetical protein